MGDVMRRLTRREKQVFGGLSAVAMDLRFDEPRRLRNALTALVGLDPRALAWIEANTPARLPRGEELVSLVRLVEARARVLLVKRYPMVKIHVISLIERDWPFEENGDLTPG